MKKFARIFFTLIATVLIFAFSPMHAKDADHCIDGGRVIFLDSNGSGDTNVAVSKDKSFAVVSADDSSTFKVFDLKTNLITEHQKPENSFVSILDSGEIAITISVNSDYSTLKSGVASLKKAKTILINPKTGTKSEAIGQFAYGGELYKVTSFDGKYTLFIKNNKGKERRILLSGAKEDILSIHNEGADAWDVFYYKKDSTLKIQDGSKIIYSGKLDTHLTTRLPGGLSPNNKLFVIEIQNNIGYSDDRAGITANGARLAVIDLDKKMQKIFSLPDDYTISNDLKEKISKDSKHMLLNSLSSLDKEVKSIDLMSGNITTHTKLDLSNPYFDVMGNICGGGFNPGKGSNVVTCIDFKTGAEVSAIEIPFYSYELTQMTPNDFVGSRSVDDSSKSVSYFISHRKICPKIVVPVECDCNLIGGSNISPSIEVVKNLAVATACSKEFSARDWKNLPSLELNSLDEKSSLVLLKRFSKPDGFDEQIHTGLLLGMLEAGLHKKYPAEFKAALGGVLYSANRLYDSLLEKYPDISNLKGKSNQSCRTAKENEKIQTAIVDYAKSKIFLTSNPEFSEFKSILNLAKDSLSNEKKSALAELAADRLVITAGDSEELNQVFPSKVHKFSENKMKEALGLNYKNLTDLTVVRDGEKLIFYELGIQPFSGSKETVAGFHAKSVKTIYVDTLPANKSVENFNWTYAEKEYSAQIEINKQSLNRAIVSTAKSPKYAEMWKAKEFRGVVIAGANLGVGLTDSVMQEYIEYYGQQGFKFEAPKVNEDLPKFLQDSISGTEPMHYFVKEAHSDGDEKNLFRISQQGKVLRGVRVVGDKKEIIDLVYPVGGSKSTLLSNQDFGKWVKAREKSGKPELVYLNSSCWSNTKAIYEISAAASPTLINIPTTTSMTVFKNNEKNVMHAAIDGIRNQKSYESIRTEMGKNRDYASQSANVFIFPDEEKYKTQITDVLKIPVDVNPKLFIKMPDGSRAPYSIEETH